MKYSIKGVIAFLLNIVFFWIGVSADLLSDVGIIVVLLLFGIIYGFIGIKAVSSKEAISGVFFILLCLILLSLSLIFGSIFIHR